MMGPQCPACGAKVKFPKNAPLPPPHAKVKCPSCGSVGELQAFLTAAGAAEPPEEVIEEAAPAAEETTAPLPPAAKATKPSLSAKSDTGTRVSGSATSLNLPAGLRCG